ncbi:hypothetical protein [Bacteroides sp.]|uniref:hypothetical protein n=1 Tax=Bacteroides sp. TaxID=29523 RepID=UPI002627E20D|nr:hypothetical protein [Bacteroides sp.]MDD3039617.1 hypothetical protein [Bacteroides sp.]
MTSRTRRVLVGCEFSAAVRSAFEAAGWEAWSCDLEETEIPGNHYKGDIRDMLDQHWDLAIFFPPCTYLSNSGVRWLYNADKTTNTERWANMVAGAEFFKMLLESDIEHICVENPVQHKYARAIIEHEYTQIIQPWQFGHGETKATCLWLKNLPRLEPTNIVSGREHRIHRMSPSADRQRERSRTFEGIAYAMADQWTRYLV